MPKPNPLTVEADILQFTPRAAASLTTVVSSLAEIATKDYDTFVAGIVTYVLIPFKVVLHDGG